jgi:hypothetical protein
MLGDKKQKVSETKQFLFKNNTIAGAEPLRLEQISVH